MELIKVRRNFQITIPSGLRKKFNLQEGDYVEANIQEDGIMIKPVAVIRPDQKYFYTKQWQKGEAEADKDISEGNLDGPFESAESLIDALES